MRVAYSTWMWATLCVKECSTTAEACVERC